MLQELVIVGIDWQGVDDISFGRLQHSMQLASNLTKVIMITCKYLPATLLAHCTSVRDLEISLNTIIGPLEGPLTTLSHLQRLSLRRNNVLGGPCGTRLWARLLDLVPAHLPNLKDLSKVAVLGEAGLLTLAGLQQLTSLWVEVVQADAMVPVGPLFRMRGLVDLHLTVEGPGQFSDYQEGASTLADLKQATQLRSLTLEIFETWEDVPSPALPWHPLCKALAHLSALTQLRLNFYPGLSAPPSALRLLSLPALLNLRMQVRQDAPEDRIWPILYRAVPVLQHLDLEFGDIGQWSALSSYLPGLPCLKRLRMSLYDAASSQAMVPDEWPSAACVLCHSGIRYLEAHNVFHAGNTSRDLPLLTAFAEMHGLAIQFQAADCSAKMGTDEVQHEWRENVYRSRASPVYSVELEPLLAPNCPSTSNYSFLTWPYIL